MSRKIYIYLVLSEESPDRARLLRARVPPADLVRAYEARTPGWYVKRVWSVRSAGDVAPVMAVAMAGHPNRSFEHEDWPEGPTLAAAG